MICKTRDFGELQIQEDSILTFTQPPFGFEQYTKYTLINNPETGKEIAYLQSLEEPSICFVLIDPEIFTPYYQPNFEVKDLDKLGQGDIICWAIAVIPEDFKNTTVNLKSPLIINPTTKLGAQIILDQEYSVRHPLIKEVE